MQAHKTSKWLIIWTILTFCFHILYPCSLYASADYCSDGTASPPFLVAGGVTPNLLMIIDNSGSMYDLAYINEATSCFDDTYDSDSSYAGYFEATTWYAYDLTNDKFITKTDEEAATLKSEATYYASDVFIDISETDGSVEAFGGKGNFLNWATASKFDIQKKILTGGKYDATNSLLVLESRGCLDRRLIKQVEVTTDGTDVYYLTLGIRPPDDTEQNADIALTGSKHTTHIEIFDITLTGFVYTGGCQDAIDNLSSDSPNLGTLKQQVKDCMGYNNSATDYKTDSIAAFNHAMQECWYYNKQDDWQPGSGTVTSMKNDCEKLYAVKNPEDITYDDMGYVCYGVYGADPPLGYVGRCWEPASSGEERECHDMLCEDESGLEVNQRCIDGYVYECSGNYNENQETCNKDWVKVQECTGGGTGEDAGWTSDDCVELGIQRYCDILEIPEVIDPSDSESVTGNVWNLPAVLIDSGVVAQIDEPIQILKGLVAVSESPSGLLHDVADTLRIGAMTFNDNGAATECGYTASPSILYYCPTDNKDGGKIIADIQQDAAGETTLLNSLVSNINAIEATSWTPLAEAMYNAIGYYTQNSNRRLNTDDFTISDAANPIQYWCQQNNVLLITDGASTADQNATVGTFVSEEGHNDGDNDDIANGCGDLYGSTWLDDLTYYAKHGSDLYAHQTGNNDHGFAYDPLNITTYIVVAGNPRDASKTGECQPENMMEEAAANGGTSLYKASDINQLEGTLREVLATISSRGSSGSAASVISSSRSGEGALYQAIFWPSKTDTSDNKVLWMGEVHALLMDEYGLLYEDTNENRTLDSADLQVTIYYNESNGESEACYGSLNTDGTCNGTSKDLEDVNYLWSSSKWLNTITADNITTNRTTINSSTNYISSTQKRYIFTWNDINADGIVDDAEIIPFTAAFSITDETLCHGETNLSVTNDRAPIPWDFGVTTVNEVNKIVNWIRGQDQTDMRSRQLATDRYDDGDNDEMITWRLGDVVHSTPTVVSRPSENYHALYRDTSYADFAQKYNNRRQVIYYGANDGMLHAVNGGFYNDTLKKYRLTKDGTSEDAAPDLGAELWAYVPYNLLPHLQCLTQADYDHKYFVDLRPRAFDAQVFADDTDHPNGWGTILVCGMRFGGAKITPKDFDLDDDGNADYPDDPREFTSAYFMLDVTNPEKPPVLLGEFTQLAADTYVDLGYTTAIPTMVPMKDSEEGEEDGSTTEWYLIFGTGPTGIDGSSSQNASLCVLPMDWLTGTTRRALRFPTTTPDDTTEGGSFTLSDSNSFISDLITVDFDIDENYKADVVYFGTVSGDWNSGWGGKMYRLVTQKDETTTNDGKTTTVQVATTPSQWSGLLTNNPLALIDANQPITAAPAVGWDGFNYWVYFGTGRFLDVDDKQDTTQQTYYGIKEPFKLDTDTTIEYDVNNEPIMTWETVTKTDTSSTNHNSTPGSQGLLRVDQIEVGYGDTDSEATLSCNPDTASCLPTNVANYQNLIDYIAGNPAENDTGTDGWYKQFSRSGERNIGQATLLSGLLTFTTFQPHDDVCLAEGLSYVYGIYYQTGTAWRQDIFSEDGGRSANDPENPSTMTDNVELGLGLSATPNIHVGQEEGSKAFAQTSTGAILEIDQPTMPLKNSKTGRVAWEEP